MRYKDLTNTEKKLLIKGLVIDFTMVGFILGIIVFLFYIAIVV